MRGFSFFCWLELGSCRRAVAVTLGSVRGRQTISWVNKQNGTIGTDKSRRRRWRTGGWMRKEANQTATHHTDTAQPTSTTPHRCGGAGGGGGASRRGPRGGGEVIARSPMHGLPATGFGVRGSFGLFHHATSMPPI
ncbi:hypothetical protein QBC41DRAFT_17586 [Cercophora samala]|uniref:Secreted protein n=1 Tax=Cercophora samala TaxID=330535 RepID=A0AA40D6G9_9PEZI|nr:hypothetical protein QBC41DRAFT_17586 [Cercophora samala]